MFTYNDYRNKRIEVSYQEIYTIVLARDIGLIVNIDARICATSKF